jgi:exopolyphosphatase / guanosine-5'-triphosphate,3'-diphosphate pyrophosphatase
VRAAVIDVGSNSVRLLLAEGIDATGAVGERVVTVTGLRRGAGPDAGVTNAALARLDACLVGYAARIRAFGATRVVPVGTAAVREAPNVGDIERLVRRRLATDLIVIPGEREAALAFAGARLVLRNPSAPCRVVDIGGGSTEVVQGDAAGPAHIVSLRLGVNRQGEAHVRSDPPRADEVRAIRDEARRMVADAAGAFPHDGTLVGVAGTVTQVAAILLGRYDPVAIHGMSMTRADVDDVLVRVSAVPAGARGAIPGLHADRVNVIVPGAAILAGVLEGLAVDEMVVSERDILDGIAMDPALAGGAPPE